MQMTLPQENYTTILSKSREGANITEEELVAMDRLIHTFTANGQSVHAAVVNNPDVIPVSEKTVHRYIDGGLLKTRNGDLPRQVGDRDVLQGAQADRPDPRLHRVRRERRAVAGVDRAPRAPPAQVSCLPVEVGAELLAPRGPRARRPLEPAQARRDAAAVWDSKPREISLRKAETPCFPARLRLHACRNGTADMLKGL